MVVFESTKTPRSERLLANTLGYPKSWHVVRVVNENSEFFDTIYAGDPNANPDTYYDHLTAMDAAMQWKEGESTPYDNNGGQMIPLKPVELEEGDEVEVYYEQDGEWYSAIITTATQYRDDVRYTVTYEVDNATQSNVCIDQIKLVKKKRKPGRSSKVEAKSKSTKRKAEESSDSKAVETPKASSKSSKKKKSKIADYQADPDMLKVARDMGLPDGWSASVRKGSRYIFTSPDGLKKFNSKRALYDQLDLPVPTQVRVRSSLDQPTNNKKNNKKNNSTNNNNNNKSQTTRTVAKPMGGEEEEDPPWRTDGHEYLSKRVRYAIDDETFAYGTVTGWISKDDTDMDGNPGFLSEKDGEPADLFHVTFDSNSVLASQDLEEYELLEDMEDDDRDA